MNQNISAAETLFSAAHPDIKKITNISALILSLLFCAVGLCLLFFSSKVEDSSSASGPVLLVGGIAFLVAGGFYLVYQQTIGRKDNLFLTFVLNINVLLTWNNYCIMFGSTKYFLCH